MLKKSTYLTTLAFFCVSIGAAQIYTPNSAIQGTTGSNRVGIGTPSPTGKLDIYGTSSDGPLRLQTITSPGPVHSPYAIAVDHLEAQTMPVFTTRVFTLDYDGTMNLGSDFVEYPALGRLNVRGGASFYASDESFMRMEHSLNQGAIFLWNSIGTTKDLIFRYGTNLLTSPEMFRLNNNGQASFGGAPMTGRLNVRYLNVTNSGTIGQNHGIYIKNNGYRSHDYIFEAENNGGTIFSISNAGEVFIGKDLNREPVGGYKLYVQTGIRTERLKIDIATNYGWADYLFSPSYSMMSIEELKHYVLTHRRLPYMVSEEQAKDEGVDLMEMNIALLKNVEELTLRVIELNEELQTLKNELKDVK